MKKTLILIIILSAVATTIYAQGGSVYTRQGMGDNVYALSARRTGLGGLGIAGVDKGYISSINPAGWHQLQVTRFESGVQYTGYKLNDDADSRYYSDYAFNGFAIGIPIQRDYGLVAALGIAPSTNVGYDVNINQPFSSPFDDISPEDDFSSFHYNGEGGLSKFFVGLSYKLPNDFVIGAMYEYLTGKIDYYSNLEFVDNSLYTNVEYTQQRSYHGSSTTFGIISSDFSYIFNSDNLENLKLAAFVNYVPELTADTSLTAVTSIGTVTKDNGIVKTEVPYKLGFGASLTWNKKYLILLDYLYQPWTEYRFDGRSISSLRDLQKVTLSVEYFNPDQRITESMWDRVVLRGGVGFEQSQYLINGEGIDKISVYAGISFPLGAWNTLDFGFEYGHRGKTANGLLEEDIFNLNVSLSFGELWFVRQER